MDGVDLNGLTILIVEDEFFVADALVSALSAAGARIIGPAASVEDAMKFVEDGTPFHVAILDINLMGKQVFPVADSLVQRDTPFVFVTGYDVDVIPERHRGAAQIVKPAPVEQLFRALIAATSKAQR